MLKRKAFGTVPDLLLVPGNITEPSPAACRAGGPLPKWTQRGLGRVRRHASVPLLCSSSLVG